MRVAKIGAFGYFSAINRHHLAMGLDVPFGFEESFRTAVPFFSFRQVSSGRLG